MAANSAAPENNPDSNTILIWDNTQYPSAIKHFFSNLCVDIEKNR